DHCQRRTRLNPLELLCEWLWSSTHQVVASLAVLLPRDVHSAYHGKPSCALVQLPRHALAGLANADRHGKGRMTPLPHQPGDLVLVLQDNHALWVTAYQR